MVRREQELERRGHFVDESTDWFLLQSVVDEQEKRQQQIEARTERHYEQLHDYRQRGVKVVDETDDNFAFFFEHPQQEQATTRPRNGIIKNRIPLSRQEKEEVLIKCAGVCIKCKKKEDLQVHHIDGRPYNNAISNLEMVCYTCHKKVHSKKKKVIQEDV